jgi:hypothetical protein
MKIISGLPLPGLISEILNTIKRPDIEIKIVDFEFYQNNLNKDFFNKDLEFIYENNDLIFISKSPEIRNWFKNENYQNAIKNIIFVNFTIDSVNLNGNYTYNHFYINCIIGSSSAEIYIRTNSRVMLDRDSYLKASA